MRLGIGFRIGPFWLSETLWRSRPRRRRRAYHGELPGWRCPHSHSREDLALECARREARRRARA